VDTSTNKNSHLTYKITQTQMAATLKATGVVGTAAYSFKQWNTATAAVATAANACKLAEITAGTCSDVVYMPSTGTSGTLYDFS
jgi:hypothetical protein